MWIGAKTKNSWRPSEPRPGDVPPRRRPEDIDPGFSPPNWRRPSPAMPEYPGPGTAITAGSMMSAGYNDPNFGLPSDGGGSFTGPGTPTSCILPMTPSTPIGGLFGPDAYAPFWGNPGYETPPDITSPYLALSVPRFEIPYIGPARPRKIIEPEGQFGGLAPSERLISFSDIIGTLERKHGPLTFGYMVARGGGGGGAVDMTDLGSMLGAGYVKFTGKSPTEGPMFAYTLAGANSVIELNLKTKAQREANKAANQKLSESEKQALAESRANAAVRDEQTSADFNKNFWHAFWLGEGAYRPWRNWTIASAAAALLAGGATLGLGISAYYGAIQGASWAMRYTARSWLLRKIGPYFLKRRFLKVGTEIYRLWGSKSLKRGKYWSPVDPRLMLNPRSNLSIPPSNSMKYITTWWLHDPTGVSIRYAAPNFGGIGGAIEIVIPWLVL